MLERAKENITTKEDAEKFEELVKENMRMGILLEPPSLKERGAGNLIELHVADTKFSFRWCPAGTFMMGSPKEEESRNDDETLHEVKLTHGFWILETEVTQEMFVNVMKKMVPDLANPNPSWFTKENEVYRKSLRNRGITDSRFIDTSQFPVECVTWKMAHDYCEGFNKFFKPREGEFRLPTEAEWEYACRAGNDGTYSVSHSSIYFDKWNEGLKAVRQEALPNSWGIYDMPGSVYEWCSDWYGPYPKGVLTQDPKGPEHPKEQKRVLRGGCWAEREVKFSRSAARVSMLPEGANDATPNVIGFRFVYGK